MSKQLSFSEELILLMVDDSTGHLRPLPEKILASALGGAFLLELAFAGRIDNDAESVFLVDTAQTDNAVLDAVLEDLAAEGSPLSLARALTLACTEAPAGVKFVLDNLIAGGTLREISAPECPAKERRYQNTDPRVVEDLRQRVRQLVLSADALPDPRDVVLLGLVEACELAPQLFRPQELSSSAERLRRLAGLEFFNQAVFAALRSFQEAPYEQIAEWLIGTRYETPRVVAGGREAVLAAITRIYEEAGWMRGSAALTRINQVNGFDCPGCSWPHLGDKRSRFEFCENGAKALASEATLQRIGAEFFQRWTLAELADQPNEWLERQGRLMQPLLQRPGAAHYGAITWEAAFDIIARELNNLNAPDEAAFYVSGRTSNEASFLLQLFARQFGTNNLAGSANLCHEASGMALQQVLGSGKGTVQLEDLEHSDLVLIFGHNPGSNHARMLETLQQTVRNGGRIAAINPLPEAGLIGFANPHEVLGILGRSTSLAARRLPVHINGDLALVKGVIKAVLDEESRAPGTVLDHDFIRRYTTGFESMQAALAGISRERIEAQSGIAWAQIQELAGWYIEARSVVADWGLGITQQSNGVATIREIVNLLLLRGNLGRPGAGVCPVRGHSNVQGNRTMGIGVRMSVEFLDALGTAFDFQPPRHTGLGAIDALQAMHSGNVKVFISMGGNLLSAAPDAGFVAEAMRRCRLTVMVSTKLNRNHAVTGEQALILPCLSRSEMDRCDGVEQWLTVEDTTGHVHRSHGCLEPAGPELRGEPWIVAAMARAVLGDRSRVPWSRLGSDYRLIREEIARVVPDFADFNRRVMEPGGMCLSNPARERRFNLPGGRARFTVQTMDEGRLASGQFLLTTLRSHDQFNTAVFGLNDRYRGIRGERRVVFMNPQDMQQLGIVPEQLVDLAGVEPGRPRWGRGFHAIPYNIPRACAAAYFPEANTVIPIWNVDPESGTPASKAVPITIRPAG
ncbi:MAG: FdhF/YdeP family oxidoreductase [Bryobacteraceae bacterium]